MGAAARLACLPPSHCASLPPLSPLLASTRRRQLQVALESLRPANDDAGGREDWRAGEEINSCGSGPVQGEGLMCMARRAEAVRSRTIHSARPAGVSRVNPKRGWFHGHSTVAIIETAFHYVNCHPRGDPVSSLSNEKITPRDTRIANPPRTRTPNSSRTRRIASSLGG